MARAWNSMTKSNTLKTLINPSHESSVTHFPHSPGAQNKNDKNEALIVGRFIVIVAWSDRKNHSGSNALKVVWGCGSAAMAKDRYPRWSKVVQGGPRWSKVVQDGPRFNHCNFTAPILHVSFTSVLHKYPTSQVSRKCILELNAVAATNSVTIGRLHVACTIWTSCTFSHTWTHLEHSTRIPSPGGKLLYVVVELSTSSCGPAVQHQVSVSAMCHVWTWLYQVVSGCICHLYPLVL